MTDKLPPAPVASPIPAPLHVVLDKEPITGAFPIPSPNTLPTKGQRWYPNPPQIIALSALVGGLLGLIDVLGADVVTTKVAALAFCKGALLQLAVYMGMRSAGPVQR